MPNLVLLGPKRGKGKKAVRIGAGSRSSFAVDENGDVWGWGMNGQGQTGTGYPVDAKEVVIVPEKVVGLSRAELKASAGNGDAEEETVVQIDGGSDHTLFLTSRGRVFSCGRSTEGQLGLPLNHAAISHRNHTIEGRKFSDTFAALPTSITFPIPTSDDPIKHIAVGEHNNLAVTRDGAVYVWGSGDMGELGLKEVERAEIPTVLVRRAGGKVEAITATCSGSHCLGLFKPRT
jgi:regulator of chromosome condensation